MFKGGLGFMALVCGFPGFRLATFWGFLGLGGLGLEGGGGGFGVFFFLVWGGGGGGVGLRGDWSALYPQPLPQWLLGLVQGWGFRVFRFRVWGLGFRFGVWVWGLGFFCEVPCDIRFFCKRSSTKRASREPKP